MQSTNIDFDVMAITETIALNNYSFEHTPTESFPGGTFLYIANHLSYKICSDFKIYNPKMDATEFHNNFLNNLLKKINHKQNPVSFRWFQH